MGSFWKKPWVPLVVAFVVSLPALGTGFVLDDWMQRAIVRGQLPHAAWWDLYSFGDAKGVWLREALERGPFPWFTNPDLRLHFFRPLSSALIALDTRVFGELAWPQHLHSSLWYVALTAVVAALYRRLGLGVAALAALLFAIDDAHSLPVSWLANRNAILAVTFAWLGLLAHLRWREQGWALGAWLSALAYGVALCAGETGVAALGYVFAYEVLGRRDALAVRARALVPMAAVLAVFAVIYVRVEAGARASATYIDPLAEPLVFLSVAPVRFLANVGGQTFGLPSDMWLSLPVLRPVLVGMGVVALVAWPLAWRRWRPADEAEVRTLKWLGLGALLSLVPTLATFPAGRLLTAPSLGVGALVAALFSRAWGDRGWRRVLGVAWLGGAFVLQPLSSWLTMPQAFHAISERTVAAVKGAAVREGEHVVVVSSEFAAAIYGVPVMMEYGLAVPATWHIWSMAPLAHTLRRTGEREVELTVKDGRMIDSVFEQNFRNERHPMRVGQRVQLRGAAVTVLAVDRGLPTAIRVELEAPLETFHFLRWDGDGLARFELPPVGEALELARGDTIFERLLGAR
ncbi:MAG: hypothetical protein ACOZQL_01085 [Myxococcota bacterium]